jgi:hypothetical protein
MGLNQLALGKNEAALQTMQQVTIEFWKLQGLALAYAALHNRGESDKALNQLIDKYAMEGAFQIAEVYSFRNEPDLAFKWLEVAQTQHDPGLVDVDVSVLLKPLHNDPRWAPFVDKVEL